MMSFCKKSVNSFLGLNNISTTEQYSCKCMAVSSALPPGGLGLINATDDTHKTPNVVESASFKSSSSPPPLSSPPLPTMFSGKKDPGGIGFIDDIGGGVDGLMSCTESLGFESSDERRVDDEIELCSSAKSTTRSKWKKGGEKREVKNFPPPISSLNHNGRPSFYLRPVRTDGRLELKEIRIDRPEILQASRQDGRLRLHFVRDDQELDVSQEGEENHQEQEVEQYDDRSEKEEEKEVMRQEEENEEVEGKIEEEGDDGIERWMLPVNGEGLTRCHHMLNHRNHHHHHHPHHHHQGNQHHDLHVWGQHCVTTR